MQVMLRKGQWVESIADYQGLAVTPGWWACDTYCVTHIESGTRVAAGLSDHDAIRLLAALVERLDVEWTDSFQALEPKRERDGMFYQRVRAIIREICGA